MPIIRLAWVEFSLPFRNLRSTAPGGRDLLWLSLLLVLVLTLGLLLLATRVGLLERFVDVFLGKAKDHGVPIWVIANPVAKGGAELVSNEVIDSVRRVGFEMYPYREVEPSLDRIELVDPQVWRTRSDLEPGFLGWAVYHDDPLWPGNRIQGGLPLTVVLNRALFEKYFDYDAYRDALEPLLPKAWWEELREGKGKLPQLERIWLRIQVNRQASLLPFEVIWVDRIPTIQQLAFLFPLPTYHALREAANHPELRYFPEHRGKEGRRIKMIAFRDSVDRAMLEKFREVTGGKGKASRGYQMITFKNPRWESMIEAFANEYGLQYRVLESVRGHPILDRRTHLGLPCSVIAAEVLRKMPKEKEGTPYCIALKNIASTGNGFLRGFVYVPDRTALSSAVYRLLKVNDEALSIHPIYQDALNRFGFLTRMLDTLRVPYGFILLTFLLAVLGIQIGSMLGHRRQRYGIFLAKGMAWHRIYTMVYLQMVFSLVVGVLGAVSLMALAQNVVSRMVQEVANEFRSVVNTADMELLPLSIQDYVLVSVSTLLLTLFFATVFVYSLPVRRRTQIGPLLNE